MPKQCQFTTDTFKRLVDKAIEANQLSNEQQVTEYFASDFHGVQPAARSQALHSLMRSSICVTTGEAAGPTLRTLKRGVFLEGALGNQREPYVAILRTLADACRKPAIRSFEDETMWIEAINAARAAITLTGELSANDTRLDSVAGAAERLVARGYSLKVESGRLVFNSGEMGRLSKELERTIISLGGLEVISQTLAYLKDVAPLYFGRHAPGRTFGNARRQPSLPIGYLLQLGVKHLDAKPADIERRPLLWSSVAMLSRDLCAVVDVEPYHNFESILLSAQELPEYLASVALFDHLFALKQWPPSRSMELLDGVTSRLDQTEIRSRLGWEIGDVLALMKAVLAVASEPLAITTSKKFEAHGVSKAIWSKLRAVFAQPLSTINSKYTTPLDADKAEFDFKPLFELPRDHLLVVTPALAALGFFEATTRAIRQSGYPDFDSRLGEAVEGVVADALRKVGVSVTVESVEYTTPDSTQGNVAGECDIVVETDTNIVFIEIKKKPLRRVSGTGDATPALVDLTSSLFDAQAQLSRHEQILLRDGKIEFTNGYTLEHRGRSIDRIAMTWLDYGGLQDKYLLSQIFTALAGHRLSTDQPVTSQKLVGLNNAIHALEQEMAALQQLGKDGGALFMNCWFLSVPQLMMLVEGVQGPTDFTDRIGKLRHLTYRTLDFYRDFGFAKQSGLL